MFSEQTSGQVRWEILYLQNSKIIISHLLKASLYVLFYFILETLWLVCVTANLCADVLVSHNTGCYSEPIRLLALTSLSCSCKT